MVRGFEYAVCAALTVLSACASREPAVQKTDPPTKVAVGMLWWPDDPSMALYPFAKSIERCLSRTIAREAPEIQILPRDTVRDALYPLIESGSQPRTDFEFVHVLERADVRARLAEHNLDYLLAFAGRTTTTVEQAKGAMLCGYGCIGFVWWEKTTALDAAIWNISSAERPMRENATDSGTSLLPALGVTVPIPAKTKSDACRELGREVVAAIRSDVVKEPRINGFD